MSYRVIETFLADVLDLPISTGQLAKIVRKTSAALAASYGQVEGTLPGRAVVNVDETSHPENGQSLWTWGFHAPGRQGCTLFHIDTARSSDVLKEFLGESFPGDSRRGWPPLVRTHLDRAGHVRPTGPLGLRLPCSLDRRSLQKPSTTIPTAQSAVNGDEPISKFSPPLSSPRMRGSIIHMGSVNCRGTWQAAGLSGAGRRRVDGQNGVAFGSS
jgi:hypothetical protein